jgi:hypothetical protein
MIKFRAISRAVAAIALSISGAALAHHSFAMFDRDAQVTLVGTVHEFQWTNPHSWIEMDVADEKGAVHKWSVEMNSPNNLQRQGWRSSTLKPGDKVTVVINPLRDGNKGGLFVSVKLPDGKELRDPTRRQQPSTAQSPSP